MINTLRSGFLKGLPIYIIILLAISLKPIFEIDSLIFNAAPYKMPLLDILYKYFDLNNQILLIVSLALIIVESLLMMNVIYKFENSILFRNILPCVLFCIMSATIWITKGFFPIVVANLFYLLALNCLVSQSISITKYLNASMFISIAVLFYFPSIIFFLTILLVLTFNKKDARRIFIVILIGFFVPMILAVSTYILTNNYQQLSDLVNSIIFSNTTIENNFTLWQLIPLGVLLIFLISAYFGVIVFNKNKNSNTREINVLAFRSVLIILAFYGIFFRHTEYLLLLTAPITISFTYFFSTKKIFENLIFLLLLGSIFVLLQAEFLFK